MRIFALTAENVKKLRVVEIVPKGRVIQITGKTGQGKTSVIDAIWMGLVGKRATPEKPVRKGADKAKIKIGLGEEKTEIVVTRTIAATGAHNLELEYISGPRPPGTPQMLLDQLFSELTFDPIAFIKLPTKSRDKAVKSKLDVLRASVKLDIDLDKLATDDALDYQERTDLNKEVKRLDAVLATYTIQAGLPQTKLDESTILKQLGDAGELNRKAQIADAARRDAAAAAEAIGRDHAQIQYHMTKTAQKIDMLQRQLAEAKAEFDSLSEREQQAAQEFEKATEYAAQLPPAKFIDVSSLTEQLQQVQLTNKEIDKRDRYNGILEERTTAHKRSEALTRRIEARAEKKAAAFAAAKLPVDGLTFDEEGVNYKGIPIEQLGGAEQIRISVELAMATNAKLRILRIDNGESMDEDDLALISAMAEEHDYQLWITRVDSSGKVGIVIEDGQVKAENPEAAHAGE